MSKRLAVSALLMLSFNSFADDYSACLWRTNLFGRVNEKGEVVPGLGERILKRTKVDGGEQITFENYKKEKETIEITRDDQNRITSVTQMDKNLKEMSKKERDQLRLAEAYKIAFNGGTQGACEFRAESHYNEFGQGGGYSSASRECPSALVFDPTHKTYVPADYNLINKKNFSQYKFMGIDTWDDFVKIRESDKKKWRADEKVAEAYSKVLDMQGWTFPAGSRKDFAYEDGKCYVSKITNKVVNGKNGAVMDWPVFDIDTCDKTKVVFDKWKEELKACQDKNWAAEKELNDSIYGEMPKPVFSNVNENHRSNSVVYNKGLMCQLKTTLSSGRKQSGPQSSSKQ